MLLKPNPLPILSRRLKKYFRLYLVKADQIICIAQYFIDEPVLLRLQRIHKPVAAKHLLDLLAAMSGKLSHQIKSLILKPLLLLVCNTHIFRIPFGSAAGWVHMDGGMR